MKKSKGFTLIELLVVIAIIAILAVIMLIALANARARSRYASGQTTMKSAQTAAVTCVNDESNLNTPPAVGTAICSANPTALWAAVGSASILPAGWTNLSTQDITVNDGTGFAFSADFTAGGISHGFCCNDNGCRQIDPPPVAASCTQP